MVVSLQKCHNNRNKSTLRPSGALCVTPGVKESCRGSFNRNVIATNPLFPASSRRPDSTCRLFLKYPTRPVLFPQHIFVDYVYTGP